MAVVANCRTPYQHTDLIEGGVRKLAEMEAMLVKTIVVSASIGVMKPLLAKLTTLMGDKYKKFKGVRRQVSFLKDELGTINAFLETLELMDELDPLVKNWRSHVREMAYDIEDCIDNFMHHVGDTDPNEGFSNKTVRRLKTVRQRHRIAHQIDKLKTRVLEASKRHKRYNLDSRVSTVGYNQNLGYLGLPPFVRWKTSLLASENIWNIKVYGESNHVPPLVLFKYLRVLILDIFSYEVECKADLTAISQLFQLRYLKIAGNYIVDVVLPTKIQGLRHLETLDMYGVQVIPSDIIYLPRLFHLIVDADTRLPDGIGSLKSLRTLERIYLFSTTINVLGELTNLRDLTLCRTDYDDISDPETAKIKLLVSSLGKLSKLRSLTLDIKWEIRDDDDQLGSLWEPPLEIERLQLSQWLFPRIPKWIGGHLSSLCSLTLSVAGESRDSIQALSELPSLLFLGLEMVRKYGDVPPGPLTVDFGSAGFASLEHLDLSCRSSYGASMRFQAGVMRRLQRLTLHLWGSRTWAGTEHLPNLRSIHALVGSHN
ncbi:hypothetical protein EJB05_57950, partial [Eragrostis curvula]